MPHSLTSFPVRGALQVAATEPTSTQALRLNRSIHFQLAARATMTSLSRTSARVRGNGERPPIAKLVIWASGNARPIASASTTGRPSTAAARKGWSAFDPPISTDMIPRNETPRYASIISHRLRRDLGILQAFLTHQRRAHAGDDGHPVVVRELHRIQKLDPHALLVELAQVEKRVIGIPASACAEDPGAGRERRDLFEIDFLCLMGGGILSRRPDTVLAFSIVARKRAAFITIGQSPRPDILDEMRPWWDGASLDIEEHGALDGLSREEIARAAPKESEERLVSRLHDGTEVLLEAGWAHHRVEDLVRGLGDGGIDVFVILCTGHFHGLDELAPKGILVRRRPGRRSRARGDRRVRGFDRSAPPERRPEGELSLRARGEPALRPEPRLALLAATDGRRRPASSKRSDLVVMHCMGYTEPMRRKLAQKTGKPVLLARRMVAAAVAQVL